MTVSGIGANAVPVVETVYFVALQTKIVSLAAGEGANFVSPKAQGGKMPDPAPVPGDA